MKILLIALSFITINKIYSCEHIDNLTNNYLNVYIGKEFKFYDTYKQGKCALDNALEVLPVEQRKIIANLIAKSYNFLKKLPIKFL